MKFKQILLITLLLLAVFTISAVSATDNLTDEEVLQDTSSEEIELSDDDIISSSEDEIISTRDDGTFTALQNKINNAASGSTITLENDYTYDEGFNNEGIRIAKSLTINGNGHKIDALGKSRILNIAGDNIVLNNINFNNGYYWKGGAIIIDCYSEGISINSCVFNNNKASSDDSSYDCMGGAVYSLGDDVVFESCKFIKNTAYSSYWGKGGAIYLSNWGHNNKGNLGGNNNNIINCQFEDNNAHYYGGAVYCAGDNCQISDSSFINNKVSSGSDGGAIYYKGSNGNLIKSTFEGNSKYEVYWIGEHGKISNCISYGTGSLKDKLHVDSTTTVENYNIKTKSNSNSQSSSSSSSTTTKITKTTPKLTAPAKTFSVKTKIKKYTATLKTNKNKAMKNVKLYLKVNGKTYTAKTNSNGKATFNIKNLKKKGTYKTTITFKGNKNYKKISKTVKIKVK